MDTLNTVSGPAQDVASACIAVYCCMLMVGKQQKLNFPHWCGYCVLAGHCVLLNKGRCGLFGSAALLLPAQLGHLPKTSTGKIRYLDYRRVG